MGRSPCCDKTGLKKGPWTQEEDEKLIRYIQLHGPANWRSLPKNAGLQRCGKSCRLRWTNYLRPDIKRGRFSFEEEETIIQLHSLLGNKWSVIAARLPGRTDNEIKNYWNTHIRKRLLQMGIDPVTHVPRLDYLSNSIGSSHTHLNFANLLGLQAILNPELLKLFGSLISQEQQQKQENPETLVPHFNPTQYPSYGSISNQTQLTQPNSSQYLSSENPLMGTDYQIMGQQAAGENNNYQRFEYWLNNINDDHNLGFDSIGSTPMSSPTPLNSSCDTPLIKGSSSKEERDSHCSWIKFEIPEGSIDIDDFL